MSIHYTGPWSSVINTLRNAGRTILGKPTDQRYKDMASAIENTIREGMKSPVGVEKLKDSTVARKAREDAPFPERPYYEWGDLVSSPKLFDEPQIYVRASGAARVEIRFSEQMHTSNLSYAQLMSYMEYGTAKQSPRPVVGPIASRLEATGIPGASEIADEIVVRFERDMKTS